VSTGSARESFSPIGSNLPDYDNYFCRDCRGIVHVRKGSPGFRACPTPGCTRPTGFGVYATVPRPRSTRSLRTVPFAVSVIRHVARIEFPSTRAEMTAARLAGESLFIASIYA
jgi:hypothetical protein